LAAELAIMREALLDAKIDRMFADVGDFPAKEEAPPARLMEIVVPMPTVWHFPEPAPAPAPDPPQAAQPEPAPQEPQWHYPRMRMR
jgi:hypothetical protein